MVGDAVGFFCKTRAKQACRKKNMKAWQIYGKVDNQHLQKVEAPWGIDWVKLLLVHSLDYLSATLTGSMWAVMNRDEPLQQ